MLHHPVVGSTVRYVIAGTVVAGVYLGLPVILNAAFGVPLELLIPVAYLAAVTLHFNLQRHFVFRHVSDFALARRQQIFRYLAMGAVQYPTTAVATAALPGALGISGRAAYVGTVMAVSAASYLFLRTQIFHPAEGEARWG